MVLTLAGVRMLHKELKGNEASTQDKQEVMEYLELKERAIDLRRQKKMVLLDLMYDYSEAIVLAHGMGILWKPKV